VSTHIVGYNTYYLTADEASYGGAASVPLHDRSGNLIATVPEAFANDLFIEGSGRLRDGRVINVAGNSCGTVAYEVAGYTGSPCYRVLSSSNAWGVGVHGWPLVPLQTIAVDPTVIPYGSWVYIEQWAGKAIPRVGTLGGFTHDGWFYAADTGGFTSREGSYGHIDIFAGTRAMYQALERIYPTRSRMDLYVGGRPMTAGKVLLAVALVGVAGAAAYYYVAEPSWFSRRKSGRWRPRMSW
jgi:3D (Asp-Asp-Asp) domain-containing protein